MATINDLPDVIKAKYNPDMIRKITIRTDQSDNESYTITAGAYKRTWKRIGKEYLMTKEIFIPRK